MKCVCLQGFSSQFKRSVCLHPKQPQNTIAPQVLSPQSMQACASEPLASIRAENKWAVLIEVDGSEAHACVFGESVSPGNPALPQRCWIFHLLQSLVGTE